MKIVLEKIKSQCNAGQGPAPNNGGAQKDENDELKSTINNNAANKKGIAWTIWELIWLINNHNYYKNEKLLIS